MPNGNKQNLYSCHVCGSKFSPAATGGVCPYCRNAAPVFTEHQRRNFKKREIRKKQLKKAALRLSVFALIVIAVIAAAIALVVNIVKSNESLVFNTENSNSSPVFFTDSSGLVYYVSKNENILIGKGEIKHFAHSENSKVAYFVFKGSRDPDSLSDSGSSLLKISGQSLETVAESSYGDITFVQGGNCEYIYYMINETISTYQSSARLYIQAGSSEPKKIAEYSSSEGFDNFRTSANGRYLLYKSEDGSSSGSTKLMRYCVKKGSSEALGIKNAEPVSIDNKGKYYSYLKINEQGLADFYIESGVSDREKTPLETANADRILISSDYRSFVIETGNLTTVKAIGLEPCVIAARTGSGVGIDIIESITETDLSDTMSSHVHTIAHCSNNSFFPYYYFNYIRDQREIMSCDKDGVKKTLTESSFSNYCTNGAKLAYISDKTLYTMSLNTKNAAVTLVSENFDGYTLESMSQNGKFIFYSDADGNLYRIPFNFNGSDWAKIAVDAENYVGAPDGKKAVYVSDGILYYSKDTSSYKITETLNTDMCFVMNDCTEIYYLDSSEQGSPAETYTLYKYDGKASNSIADNVSFITAAKHLSIAYDCTPYSTYVEHITPDVSSRTDKIADNIDTQNSSDNSDAAQAA